MKRLRWMMVSAVFGLLALLGAGSGARAAIYTWVDAKGVTHIQSSPPPAGIKPLHVDGAAGEEVAGPGQKKNSVELYTTSGCSWCKKAKDYFRSQGVPFIEYDVERDREAAAQEGARQFGWGAFCGRQWPEDPRLFPERVRPGAAPAMT